MSNYSDPATGIAAKKVDFTSITDIIDLPVATIAAIPAAALMSMPMSGAG